MYQAYKLFMWIKRTFFCIHEWTWKEYGIGHESFATCKKCGKFTKNT